MADIPQEVREVPFSYAEYGAAMYNNGYQAGLAAGKRAGMERAAEIAENSTVDWLGDDCCFYHAHDIAQAIRSENDGHG